MRRVIYIPIWLDLLSKKENKKSKTNQNLHSNMVRFIMSYFRVFQFCLTDIYIPIWLDLLQYCHWINEQYYSIYIPIWLDLLFSCIISLFSPILNLHSNMVRFIIDSYIMTRGYIAIFTFQYGQIYYYSFYEAY